MAALMTSVIDNPGKVSEYIYSCRQMGIKILPPDINKGEGSFSVDGGNIRYGLAAIKSIGKPVIESIIQERKNGGGIQQPERLYRTSVRKKKSISARLKALSNPEHLTVWVVQESSLW